MDDLYQKNEDSNHDVCGQNSEHVFINKCESDLVDTKKAKKKKKPTLLHSNDMVDCKSEVLLDNNSLTKKITPIKEDKMGKSVNSKDRHLKGKQVKVSKTDGKKPKKKKIKKEAQSGVIAIREIKKSHVTTDIFATFQSDIGSGKGSAW